MKKILFVVLAALITCGISAGNWGKSRDIRAKDLPENAQAVIKKHFGGLSSVTMSTAWPNNYGVYLESGQKLNFYLDGSLKQAKTNAKPLPMGVLKELPKTASSYIVSKYGGWALVEVEMKSSKIEVKLEQGGLEAKLKFNRFGNLIQEKVKD